ncbi:MAG TPA: excinuclease ABC subunit UvrA [Thermoleophilia bacterium]|nr:excinuclease ABC subunit UvrA [Thermoleophilia bacterium]HQJ97517.1 excinuclease ABC subunit UvrA [Thermoleophilia bacterium]
MSDSIVITGAREHNLKDISITLPRDRFIVITGISGSGKSSLAFDTIYAEGQRRYVESLSAYARQFLGQMDKPDVDSIEGLSPAISIDQKTTSRNPRSTVGTVTEIYDYLRLLYARIGHPHCPNCGRPIAGQSVQQIVDQVCELEPGTRFSVVAPLVRGRKGEYGRMFEQLRADGFTRVKVDGQVRELDERFDLDKKYKHDIAVIVDRLVMKEGLRRRLTDSVETAAQLADGLVEIELADGRTLTFSEKFACVECGISMPEIQPRVFSFNNPHGACPACHGLGATREIDPGLVVPDGSLSIAKGALLPYGHLSFGWLEQVIASIAETFHVDVDVPWDQLPQKQRDLFLYGTGSTRIPMSYRNYEGRVRRYTASFPGIIAHLQRRHAETESDAVRQKIEDYMSDRVCPECGGARLKPTSLAVTVGGRNIHEFTGMSVREAMAFLERLELTETERIIGARVIREIEERLRFMEDVGVGYLDLRRAAATLSGGEAQRIRLATQIGAALVGVLYILDEPSIGLHQRDNRRLIDTLLRLRDIGNTVIVVEHDEETMRAADHVVDMGPGAGEHGGCVVAQGTPDEIAAAPGSLTGDYLAGRRRIEVPGRRRLPVEWVTVRGARMHNLRDIDVSFPVGAFTCVTGVSGSGKSTLVNEILYKGMAARLNRGSKLRAGDHRGIDGAALLDKVIAIDQSPIGRTPRSNPATYTGVFDHIRQLFAQTPESKLRGYRPGRFSFNVKGGRCETCRGDGQIKIEMHFLPDVYVPCEACRGKRYNRDTLEVWYKGKNIAEVLEMSVEEAVAFFAPVPRIARRLQTLLDVGLGYVKLGQPATTLSGGEAQRVKLAAELSKVATGRTLYILDEPTTGLHFADIEKLLEVLQRLVDQGNTVVVIEHNLDVVKSADWIVDLGPEGGDEGGEVVATGTPEDLAAMADVSYTGRFLAQLFRARPAIAAVAPGR